MKKYIYPLIFTGLFYLIGAFSQKHYDPMNWSQDAIVGLGLLTFGVWFIRFITDDNFGI